MVMDQHTLEAARLLGTLRERMTVLISLPNRGGIQPAVLQTNFANRFVAENWFIAPVPFWRPHVLGLGRCHC